MKKVISIYLTLCILMGLMSTLTGCSGKNPFEKGSTTEATIKAGNF
jgi:predicted small lipoprotein YifL